MRISELKERLREIPEDAYSLEGGLKDDTFCIEECESGWRVYYTERGNTYDQIFYFSEEEACCDLYTRLCKIFEDKKYE